MSELLILSCGCLEGGWNLSEKCMAGTCWLSEGCRKGVWRVSLGCPNGYLVFLDRCSHEFKISEALHE